MWWRLYYLATSLLGFCLSAVGVGLLYAALFGNLGDDAGGILGYLVAVPLTFWWSLRRIELVFYP